MKRPTALTIKQKFGEDFYQKIGAKGGKAPYRGKKGFAANKELARIAGRKGGLVPRKEQ